MTQEIRDPAIDPGERSEERLAELEATLRERTKQQKLSARQVELAESRLRQVERERDDLLEQVAGLEADLEAVGRQERSAAELGELSDRYRGELETARRDVERSREEVASLRQRLAVAEEAEARLEGVETELASWKEEASARSRESEELRTRLRALESRHRDQEALRDQVAALEEELAVLRKQNRDLEALVLDANSEVQKSRRQADDLWRRITGANPRMTPEGRLEGEDAGETDGPRALNDDAPSTEVPKIRGGDLSQLMDVAGGRGETRERPPFTVSEPEDDSVDVRAMMKDTTEMVGDDPIPVPEEILALADRESDDPEPSPLRDDPPPEPAEPASGDAASRDRSRLMAILSGEGTVDGDAPWESDRASGAPLDPKLAEAATLARPPVEARPAPERGGPGRTTTSRLVDAGDLDGEEKLGGPSPEVAPPVELPVDPPSDPSPTMDTGAMAVASEPEPIEIEYEDDLEDESPPRAVEAPGRLLGTEDLASQAAFQRLVGEGARFHPTDRFGKVDLVNRIDIQVSDWLDQSTDFQQLQEVSGGRMADARLLEVLWVFFQRRMFRLEER